MNLMSLFNYKYLLQNLKKSKALIILLVLLVPMFTSIMLLSLQGDYPISFAELSIFNIIFMYIIPIILSMSLFNYVYKKNSVDFIGSMPLSRKTIFLTNTIGGIAIIAIMQLITMISTMFLAKVLSGVIIFGSMVWDVFIFFTVAYIFVFTVSNLAMSLSGNRFSQLVAICLILFLVPFLIMSGDLLGDSYSYVSIEDTFTNYSSGVGYKIRIDEPYNFTAPSYIFDMILDNSGYEYSSASVVKMTILSVIYIVIGLIFFSKKKLEMAGESYESVNTHLVIKLLTFAPFMFVFCTLGNSDRRSVFLFFIAILAVYYFVFDLITNKKIKLKLSIPAFVISALIMFAIYEGIIPQFGRDNAKIINVDDIESIYIDSIKNYSADFDLLIEDKELIALILNESESQDYYYEDLYYSGPSSVDVVEIPVEQLAANETKTIEIKDSYRKNGSNAKLILKTKNGKTYEYTRYLSYNVYNSILKAVGTQMFQKSINDMVPVLYEMRLTDQERDEIIEVLNNELSKLTYQELYDAHNSEYTEYRLYLYEYKNHKLIENIYSSKAFSDLYQKMMEICNKKTVQLFSENGNYRFYKTELLEELIESKNPQLFGEDNTEETKEIILDEIIYDVLRYSENEVEDFIRKDSKNSILASEPYVIIRTYYSTYYYTNNLEGVYNLVAKLYNEKSDYIKLNIDL